MVKIEGGRGDEGDMARRNHRDNPAAGGNESADTRIRRSYSRASYIGYMYKTPVKRQSGDFGERLIIIIPQTARYCTYEAIDETRTFLTGTLPSSSSSLLARPTGNYTKRSSGPIRACTLGMEWRTTTNKFLSFFFLSFFLSLSHSLSLSLPLKLELAERDTA